MATWSWTEYLNTAGYGVSPHSSWSRYTATIKSSDTVSVRTIYNGGSSNATSVNYITAPNGSTTVNDPDPTTSDTGLDKTWTSSGFSDSDYHTRWYWFTAGSPQDFSAQKSVRILVIPSSVGWSGVQASIEQGSSGNAVLTIPTAFQGYLTGTSTDTGDALTSTEQTKDERFFWRITSSASSHTDASGFTTSSGAITSPTNADFVSISPTTSATPGTYYIKLYHYNVNGTTGSANELLDVVSFTVTQLVPLDTTITLTSTAVTLTETATNYSGFTMTGGGSNTIYYILNVNNFADGSNIDALRQNSDSRYVARTFSSSTGTRTFETIQSTGTITASLPSTGTYSTFYVYAANGLGQNSTKLSNTYTVGRADTSITLTPSTTSIGATSTANVTVNVTGDTSGTQYRLYTNNINRWVSTYNGGGSSTTDFTISYDENPDGSAGTGFTELPGIGQTYTYYSQARTSVQEGPWVDTNDSFTVTRSNLDTQPKSFELGNPVTVVTGVTANSATITIEEMDTGASASYSITNTSYSRVSKNGGTFSTSSGTVVNGDTLQVQVDASTTSGVTRSTTLSVGSPSTSDSFSVTSTTGGGGGGTSGGGGTGSYGLRVNDTDGSTFIMGSAERFSSVLALQSISLTSSNPSDDIPASMSGVSTSNSTVMFLGAPPVSSNDLGSIVTYTSNGITIDITNSDISILNATVLFVRW